MPNFVSQLGTKRSVMENANLKIIDCDGLHVAVTLETDSCKEAPIYYPANFLIHVEQGTLKLEVDKQVFTVKEGEFCLVRKYTHGTYYKEWRDDQNGFREHIFVLQDPFIKEVINNFPLPEDFMPCTLPMIKLPKTPVLQGLMDSIDTYVTGQAQIDRQLIRLKTMEALHAITSHKPELIHIFNEFSEPERADLVQFVEHNYTQNLSLEQFAQLSGRSLSTFNREFRKIFDTSPHKWFKKKRLELAKKLLSSTPRTASDVYLEVGFEDLAHFSRSFKSHFGINPSEIKSGIQA